jgi:hypothetical protein
MGLLDIALAPIRSVLGTAERGVLDHTTIDEKILDGVEAMRRTTESIEKHIEVVEALAASLPPLTESVTRLTDQIGELLRLTAPLAAAEHDIERVEHLFGRHRHHDEQRPEPAAE